MALFNIIEIQEYNFEFVFVKANPIDDCEPFLSDINQEENESTVYFEFVRNPQMDFWLKQFQEQCREGEPWFVDLTCFNKKTIEIEDECSPRYAPLYVQNNNRVFDFINGTVFVNNEKDEFDDSIDSNGISKYMIISIQEIGQYDKFQSALLVKVNPVKILYSGFRDVGQFVGHEYEKTIWLIFKNDNCNHKLNKLKNYASACESNVFLELDLDNWFNAKLINVNEEGNLHMQKVHISRDHDDYFDEMDYYYLTHENEKYTAYEEQRYVEQQRRLRAAGRPYDDYIDSLDGDDYDDDEDVWI